VHDGLLLAHPLVASLTSAELAQAIALLHIRSVQDGSVLVAQGAAPTGLHLLLAGAVHVAASSPGDVPGPPHELAVLGPGSWVGEQGLLDGGAATATCTTIGETVVATVAPADGPALLAVDAIRLQLDAVARRRSATNRATRSAPIVAGLVAGLPLRLRLLWPEDWRHLAATAPAVSDASMRRRFLQPPPFTERTFRRLAAVDLTSQLAWAAFVGSEPVGVARYGRLAEDRSAAEVALLVVDAWQAQGVGPRLLTALAVGADVHGIRQLVATARAENEPVRKLLERGGATIMTGGEGGTVTARWPVTAALQRADHAALRAAVRPVVAEVLAGVTDD
jgi:CRP-like cAMP-binding protein/RimJ/RimL family protein N-acetyltransferase